LTNWAKRKTIAMTEKELFRLEEIACQIKGFYDYPIAQCMKENLEDFFQEAQKAIQERSPELWQKFYDSGIGLVDNHFELKCWLKDAVHEFGYWSSKNILIAEVILEYLGMLTEVHKAAKAIRPPAEPYLDYIENIGNNIKYLSALLYSPELERKGKYLSDKLYGIYYAEMYLQEDRGFTGMEVLFEKFEMNKESARNVVSVKAGDEAECTKEADKTQNKTFISLRDSELRTLEAIRNAYPEILTLDKIEDKAKRSRNTICTALTNLRKHGFVAKNESGNNTITQAGFEFFDNHF
jgi:hypothetical protein